MNPLSVVTDGYLCAGGDVTINPNLPALSFADLNVELVETTDGWEVTTSTVGIQIVECEDEDAIIVQNTVYNEVSLEESVDG